MFGLKTLIGTISPILDQQLTDDKLKGIIDNMTINYPLGPGEVKNIGTISLEKNGIVYFCICGIDNTGKITEIKKQWKLVEGIKNLLSNNFIK